MQANQQSCVMRATAVAVIGNACLGVAELARQRFLRECAGQPIGVEFRMSQRKAWAVVIPNLNGEQEWKIQYFDEDGFSGHTACETLDKAVDTMIAEGFTQFDPGRLDKLVGTIRWDFGVKKQTVRDRFNQGLITWAQMVAEIATLNEFHSER